MKTKLYDYQDKAAGDIVNRMHNLDIKGAYLGFETGTGKTVTSLSVADRLRKLRAHRWNNSYMPCIQSGRLEA